MFHKTLTTAFFAIIGFTSLIVTLMWLLSAPAVIKREAIVMTEQNKTGVVKEAYLAQEDGSFLHEYLSAKKSTFKIVKNKQKTEFIENLDGISAVLEEMISQGGKPVKQIRSFQASTGVWDYATKHLKAKKASISIVESQKSGLKPVFQGQADSLDLQISEGKPKFTIEGFKAKLNKDKP